MCLAIPGRLRYIDGTDPLLRSGRVDFGGVLQTVNLSCVPHARIDDYVLVHAGMAIGTIDEAEARRVFDYLREMGELEDAAGEAS